MTRVLLERCLQTLTLPCDMDNGVREKIVNSTIEAIRAELARPESTEMTMMRACYEEQKKLAQQERKPMTREQRELLLRKADTLDGIVLAVEAFHGIKETP